MAHRWNPVRDLMTLQERMNSLFEEAARQRSGEATAGGGAGGTRADEEAEMERADWHPSADVYENESEYIIALDLPGIERNALDVSLDDNRLTIKGERARAETEAEARRAERPFGRFLRSFTLPTVVDRDGITADYKDGVLRLRLPKRQEKQSRRVEIKIS